MRSKGTVLFTLILFSLGAACSRKTAESAPGGEQEAQVQEPVESKKEAPESEPPTQAEPTLETAAFSVPGITDEGVKKLSAALADDPGVVSAKADNENELFRVTFKPGKSNPGDILAALKTVDPQIAFKGVEKAEGSEAPAGHACGGCPMRHQCGGEEQ